MRPSPRSVRPFALALALASCGGEPARPSAPSVSPPSVSPPPAPLPAPVLEGEVVGAAGEPVAGALVSASSHFDLDASEPAYDERTDARGHFRFARLPPGRHGLTATSADQTAGYAGGVEVTAGGATVRVTLRLGGTGVSYEGTVRDESGAVVADARVLAPALRENEDEVYATRTDARGNYHLRLPAGRGYFVVADAPPRPRAYRLVEPVSQRVDLRLDAPPAPRPEDAVIAAWLREHATPLSLAPELDDAGARAFGAVVGEAPLVAMGEATHGSADFPEWRRRVFQALVRDKGFTVYAVEVGWAEAFALDDYVVHGKGDPRQAIRGLFTWKDQTEETLRLVEWMRLYNADPRHPNKLHFEGFDVFTPNAAPLLLAYLRKVDPGAVAEAEEAVAPLASIDADGTYPALPPEARARTCLAVDALVGRMDTNRAAYTARSSEAEWARGRQLARMIQQAEKSYPDYGARDGQLVENIRWLVDHHPPGTKILLDAHNGHVAAEARGFLYMGRELREAWGAGYVSIGFAFGQGGVYAMDWQKGPSSKKAVFELGSAPQGTFDGALGLAGLPAFLLDMRRAEGPVGAWLRSPQRVHHVGGRFEGPDQSFQVFTPARAFDAVIYLGRVEAIHPL